MFNNPQMLVSGEILDTIYPYPPLKHDIYPGKKENGAQKPDLRVHTCNPITWEAETGDPPGQGPLELHTEF